MEIVKVDNVVEGLNNFMESRGSVLRFKSDKDFYPIIRIYIDDEYVENEIALSLTKEFYKELERYLEEVFEIRNISYNNVRSCFWHDTITR